MNLLDDIPEGSLVALDTVVWIYEVEANPVFGPVVHPFFRDRLSAGLNRAGSSLLTLGELLVQPLAMGRNDLADRYRGYLTTNPDFTAWDVTRSIIERAAALRAKYGTKMLDSLHLASALENGAALFVSNDAGLRRVSELRVLILADYLPSTAP